MNEITKERIRHIYGYFRPTVLIAVFCVFCYCVLWYAVEDYYNVNEFTADGLLLLMKILGLALVIYKFVGNAQECLSDYPKAKKVLGQLWSGFEFIFSGNDDQEHKNKKFWK